MKLTCGDIGAASEMVVCTDLLLKGYDVFRAVSPSASCDLVVFCGEKLFRIEVRTAAYKSKNGRLVCGKATRYGFDVLAMVYLPAKTVEYKPPLPVLSFAAQVGNGEAKEKIDLTPNEAMEAARTKRLEKNRKFRVCQKPFLDACSATETPRINNITQQVENEERLRQILAEVKAATGQSEIAELRLKIGRLRGYLSESDWLAALAKFSAAANERTRD